MEQVEDEDSYLKVAKPPDSLGGVPARKDPVDAVLCSRAADADSSSVHGRTRLRCSGKSARRHQWLANPSTHAVETESARVRLPPS
jgi:hypothetical protein